MAMEQESALLNLPADALLAVLGLVGPQDLLRCASCCRLLCTISRSDCLWLSLCKRWRPVLHLPSWRSSVQSGPELFRLLSAFDRLLGTWVAQGHQPRGSLLYVTWGNCRLVACKVLACTTGELKLEKAFEIFGLQDGSFKVELISKDPENPFTSGNRLSGKLLWDSKNASEFTVQAIEHKEGIGQTVSHDGTIEPGDNSLLMQLLRSYHVENNNNVAQSREMIFPDVRNSKEEDGVSEQAARARRVNLLQHLLDRRFVNEEDQYQPQKTVGLQRALQYLIRIASPTRHNLSLTGHCSEESNMDQGQVVRCSYSRLMVKEATEESDLVGLWVGVYGPHGTEIINVTENQEGIFGTKVLGDPNVPCGQVSFRASRCFETSDVPVELQQIVDLQTRINFQAFNIAKLLEGYGRIAGHNFRNPLWVPGHLLVSGSGQIAFLWEDVNFVVPFEKLNLAALYQSHKHLGMI